MTGALVFCIHGSFAVTDVLGIGYHPIPLAVRVALVVQVATTTRLLSRRPATSSAWCAAAFVSVMLPVLATTWVTEMSHAAAGQAAGRAWELFLGPKIAMFVIAAAAPSKPRWLAPALLGAFGLEQLALWFVLDLGSPTANVTPHEPGVTLATSTLAVVLLAIRIHRAEVERQLVASRLEAAMLRTTNEAFLAVKDLANTPVQNLELALSLLQTEDPENPLLARARRALSRLRELHVSLPVAPQATTSVDHGSLERLRELHANGNGRTPAT